MENYLLEINLISAQGLKPPSTNLRRMQTYALAFIDPSSKLRTRIDRIGGENPNWSDKFLFRVTADFLSTETSAVSVEIYAVGVLKDPLIGTVRFLIRNCFSSGDPIVSPASGIGFGIPSFSAVQVRRPSGRFHGVLNIGSMVISGSDTAFLTGISAMGYRYLMGETEKEKSGRKRQKSHCRAKKREEFTDENYCENTSCGDNGEISDADSSCSSTTTTTTSSTSTVLKDWNGRREIAGMFCGLGFQRKDSSDSVRSEIADGHDL